MKAEQAAVVGSKLEYGLVLCRNCNEIMYTLPTNRVKRFYSLCESLNCRELQPEAAVMASVVASTEEE
ncbi:SR1 protein [Paenibacillaceae bacterium GAS479]|nr:SR1 protein [Paenibacillaceae bacterium GAS479]